MAKNTSRADENRCRESLVAVIEAFESQEALANFCEVSPQTVSEWVRKSRRIPICHVDRLSVELRVPPSELRPDLARILKEVPLERVRVARVANPPESPRPYSPF